MSMDLLSSVAIATRAQLRGDDAVFARVVTDTRALADGDLYAALKGENFDGHEFVEQARTRGAAGAIVSRYVESALPQLVAHDVLTALQVYAASWRGRFDLPVIGVTGSNGKTSTKQMLAAICAARGPVLATRGNLNNHIGVPLTLLELRGEHRTAVIEMGANHPGEIELLTGLARPGVGIVTQAGDAHLEGFGSREGVARAKGELFASLGGGIAVINADDAYADLWRAMAKPASVITFGLSQGADVRALQLQPEPTGAPIGTRFEMITPQGKHSVHVPMPGRHNVLNALGAAACALAIGMDLEEIAAGLAQMQPAAGRVAWKTAASGARVLDDSYNANPTSLRAALELLASVPGERWAVLGGMAELGPDAPRLHHEAGQAARALGIDRLFTLGALAAEAAKGFGADAETFDDADTLAATLARRAGSGTAVLVKGSRSSRMERIVAALTGEQPREIH
jgi:UDP-N-acetylmuramoyl-tripeptide--D-alanyl-D-alanine ligase